MRTTIINYLARSPVSTLCLMTVSFLGFGCTSLNLFLMFHANLEVIQRHGWMILREGAALQFIEVVSSAFVSVIFYSLWKLSERLIVDWMTNKH